MLCSQNNYILLLCGLLLVGCGGSTDKIPPSLELEFEHKFSMGHETHENDFLAQPLEVVLDSQGNIFVADNQLHTIRMFDAEGQWVRDIGSRGEGPGEFEHMGAITVDDIGVLHVVGPWSLYIDQFDTRDGAFIGRVPFGMDATLELRILRFEHLTGNEFVAVGPRIEEGEPDEENRVLHHFRIAEESVEVLASFLPAAELASNTDLARKEMQAEPRGTLYVPNEREVLFVPRYYEGTLWHFTLVEDRDEWQEVQTYEGYVHQEMAFEEIPADAFEELAEADELVRRRVTQVDEFVGIMHNLSQGLSILSDGRMAHFTLIRSKDGDRHDKGVELFAADGTLLGYGRLPSFDRRSNGNDDPYRVIQHAAVDGLYVLNHLAAPPAVHAVDLAIEIDD